MTNVEDLTPAREPDYAIPPGETLRERLDELGMSQADLARRTGLTTKHINQVMQGLVSLTADVAQRLEYVTGIPVRWWLRLEADYQAAQTRLAQSRPEESEAAWIRSMPVTALVNIGVLPPEPRDQVSRLHQLLTFFGVANIQAYARVWEQPAAAFRQSHAYAIDIHATSAWLRLGELAAQPMTTRFSSTMLRASLSRLRALTAKPLREGLAEMVEITSNCGLSVVFVPDISGTRAYGATRWISSGRHPVVQLSRRGGHDDNLWATLFHEFGHVLDHDRKSVFIDEGDEKAYDPAEAIPNYEEEAQRFTWNLLIPEAAQGELHQLKKVEDILDFAEQLGIAPSLVLARLRYLGLWSYRHGSALRRRIHESDLPGDAVEDISPRLERDQRRMRRRLPGSES